MTTSSKTLHLKIAVKAEPGVVWEALTVPEQIERWFLRRPRVDLRAGGRYEMHCGDTAVMSGIFTEVAEQKTLAFTWSGNQHIILRLAGGDGETVLSLEGTGYTARGKGLDTYLQQARGWTFYLINLKTWLEQGWDLRETDPARSWDQGWVNSYD